MLSITANGQYVAEELRYYYDGQGKPSALKHLTFNSSGTETGNTLYYLGTTLAGDVCHIYDESDTVLATYIYDAWGNVTETVELAPGGNAIANLNPLRYRGYYFDTDTGYYYLNSRYYSAEWGRMISPDNADVVTITPMAFTDKNLYAYCDNNPVMRTDGGGEFWDVILDVVSLAFSIADVIQDPTDPLAWVGLAADVVSLAVPGLTGGGTVVKAFSKADDAVDIVKTIDRVDDIADTAKVGWKAGDDITNLTKAGQTPSWSTVCQRYWKNEAINNASKYADADLSRMKKGLAPIKDAAPMELHHPYGRANKNFFVFEPLTKAQHHFIHYGW